jgi:acylphosphatase
VGFRWFVLDAAERCGVQGWVRNQRDGSVEAEASGPRPHLEAFAEELRRGPVSARVTGVDLDWLPTPREHDGFQIRH